MRGVEPRCILRFARIVVLSLTVGGFAIAALVLLTGCGPLGVNEPKASAARSESSAPAVLHGGAARAAQAVAVLDRALHQGDVERLCRPGAVFTPAVVATLKEVGSGCEASLELSSALRHPPALTVTRLHYEPGLATSQVRVGRGGTMPLDIVHYGRRWLVSFSGGASPIGALEQRLAPS
jgi:hypothetical protein